MAKPISLKTALADKLTKEELALSRTSYDVVGDIAIIDVPDELLKKKKIIGKTLLSLHKPVNVVCMRAGNHEGKFRTQKLSVIAGENRKVTISKENACRIKVDVEKDKLVFRGTKAKQPSSRAGKEKPKKEKLAKT